MIKKFVDFLIKKRFLILIFSLLISFIGIYSYYVIPKQENPNTSVAAAIITTVYPGASPVEVEKEVTNVIEKHISKIDEIDYTTSYSLNSASVIVIMYDMEYTIDQVEANLRQVVEDAGVELPDMCMASSLNTDVTSENQFIISLSGKNYTDSELANYAENVANSLRHVEGIDEVNVDGQKNRQVEIVVDNERLKSYGINIENIVQLLMAQNLSIPTGSIEYDESVINVVMPALFESLSDIENVVISGSDSSLSFVKLKDVANITIQEVGDYAYYQDGENAILLTGTIKENQNAVLVGNDLRKAIDSAKINLPEDVSFHEAMYAPQDIENSINNFILNLIESILLIILVVMAGVKLKNAIVISIALPLSILSTFIVMKYLNIEFQFISIAALIVSLGILVDNAIVMSEAIQFNLNKGYSKQESIEKALQSCALPIFSSTITTIITFSIIYFVPGVVGKIAGTIPTVVITALIASYIVAMIVTPVLAYIFFEKEKEDKIKKDSIYKKIIQKSLNYGLQHKIQVIFMAFMTLAISVGLVAQLGMRFFPVANKPILYINFEAEAMSISNSTHIAQQINAILDEEEIIDHYTSAIGSDLPSFFLTVPSLTSASNVGRYMLQLNTEKLEEFGGIEEVSLQLQKKLDTRLTGVVTSVKCLEYSMPTQAKITYIVSGDNESKIKETVNLLKDHLSQIEGTDNIRDTLASPQYEYEIELDSNLLSSYGLLKYDVLKQANTALMGATTGTFLGGNEDMNIVVKSNISSLSELQELQIIGSVSNIQVTLDQVADIKLSPSVPVINHYNGQKFAYVLSDVLSGYSSLSIENELNKQFLNSYDQNDVSISGYGEVKNMMDLISNLGISSLIAILLIYLVLYIQFKNAKFPFIVLASIPLSLIGCCLGLWLFNMDIQVMALLGLVSLFGIVVNNGILLVEAMNEKIQSGNDITVACCEAVNERYRPIFMSSITTCIGLVPLILSQDDMVAPMASVLLFGLLLSTLLTMVVVPTLYALSLNSNKK